MERLYKALIAMLAGMCALFSWRARWWESVALFGIGTVLWGHSAISARRGGAR